MALVEWSITLLTLIQAGCGYANMDSTKCYYQGGTGTTAKCDNCCLLRHVASCLMVHIRASA
jgi:hypothetical protein